MAKKVFLNGKVTVNGVDWSNYCSSVTWENEREEVQVTGLQSLYHEILPGVSDSTLTIELFNDYAVGSIDSQMDALYASSSPVTVAVRPDAGAISTSNPEYQFSALPFTNSPISAAHGEALTKSVVFRNATQTGVVRDVTP